MKEIDGEWFKARLHDLRKSQAGLARHIDADKSTINHMLAGSRRMQIEEVERIAAFMETSVLEILARAGLEFGGAALEVAGASADQVYDDSGLAWVFPTEYIQSELRADIKSVKVIEVVGDSMAPTVCSGDRILIDTGRTKPSPAGVFAIDDGFGVVIKRLTHIIQSEPPSVRVSDDARADGDVVPADAVKVLGRAVGVVRRI